MFLSFFKIVYFSRPIVIIFFFVFLFFHSLLASFSLFSCFDFLSFLFSSCCFRLVSLSRSLYLSCCLFHSFIFIVCFFLLLFYLFFWSVYLFSFTGEATNSLPSKLAFYTSQSLEFFSWYSLVSSSNPRRSADGRRSVYRTSRRFCSLHSGGRIYLPPSEEEGAGPQYVQHGGFR